jgi:predicted nucleic acid-binding protein
MKIFDASAILNLLEEGTLPDFSESATINLALYEIGNAVWKQVHLTKRLNQSQGEKIILSASLLIEKMKYINIDVVNTLKIAVKEGLTFYDASYIQIAYSTRSELITDDKKLRDKAEKYVETAGTSV